MDPSSIRKLSAEARAMLIASGPDDITGDEGSGVELNTGADYAVAKALERRGFGHREGPGGSLPGMYWSTAAGLQARTQVLNALLAEDGEP